MTKRLNRSAALRRHRACIAVGAAALLLAACGGGGGGNGAGGAGGSSCSDITDGRSHALAAGDRHALACSTNGLSPGDLDGLGFLVGFGILETSPVDLAVGIPVNAVVRVTFNKGLAVAPGVVVRDAAGRAVAGSIVVDGTTILFRPDVPLAPGMTYSVVIDGGQSVDGDSGCGVGGLGGPCHLAFSFTTA